ncbi:tyrosine-type recombinase/integrase [Streptomyces sp. NPDC059989]|uniref:tyrosine-type recombinase/integrase n=1 Tax=Streptomyces sp. NPDC059989 TaxID=3347026 RepID=UPI003683D932
MEANCHAHHRRLRRRRPTPARRRTTGRRGGYPSQDSAEQALRRFLEGEAGGFYADPKQTAAAYLNTWLTAKALVLKPTTMARYRDYVRNDLVPAFGTLRLDQLDQLDQLAHRHISAFVTSQPAAGRGRTTLYRCLATLSRTADLDRGRSRPLPPALPAHRPGEGRPVRVPHRHRPAQGRSPRAALDRRPPKRERPLRTLHALRDRHQPPRHHHPEDPYQQELGRHLTPRRAALQHRARSRAHAHSDPSDPFSGLVFCRPDGRPLRPHTVLDRLRQLSQEAGVPRVTVHDLRHLAATITITAGVPLTVVSKTLRHSTLSTTANLYSHLTQQAAREAVNIIDHTLTGAETANHPTGRTAWLRPPRDHIHRLSEVVRRIRSPAAPAFRATASRPQTGPATTLLPPWPRTHERPPSR